MYETKGRREIEGYEDAAGSILFVVPLTYKEQTMG
jgi:hypothetical protein